MAHPRYGTREDSKRKQPKSSPICATVGSGKSKVWPQATISATVPHLPLSGLFLSLALHIQHKDPSVMGSISHLSPNPALLSLLHHPPVDPCNSFPASRLHPHSPTPSSIKSLQPSQLLTAFLLTNSRASTVLPSPASSVATFHSPTLRFEFLKSIMFSLLPPDLLLTPYTPTLVTATRSLFS